MSETENTPDRVTEAFDEYVSAFRAGRGDARPFLDRFEGRERGELELLIEAFISTAPVSDPDRDDPAFKAVVNRVISGLDGEAGGLSALLATLRAKSKLTQSAVVGSLAKLLDATPAEEKKIDSYYHALEWGSLPARGLSDRLLDSLAAVLGTSRDELREAGQQLGPSRASATGPVFARMVDDADLEQAPEARGMRSPADPSGQPDRIDRLFTGGPQGE